MASAVDFLETTTSILTDTSEAFNLLEALNQHTDFLYGHNLGVSVYSVMIGKALGWQSAGFFMISGKRNWIGFCSKKTVPSLHSRNGNWLKPTLHGEWKSISNRFWTRNLFMP